MPGHFRPFYKISKLKNASFLLFSKVFFGKDLPLFLTKKISKKQNCGLAKFLLISFKNELLLKKFSDSKSMTLLYKYIPLWYFCDKYYRHYESLKNVQNITLFFLFFQNITFHGVICRFQRFCLGMIDKNFVQNFTYILQKIFNTVLSVFISLWQKENILSSWKFIKIG